MEMQTFTSLQIKVSSILQGSWIIEKHADLKMMYVMWLTTPTSQHYSYPWLLHELLFLRISLFFMFFPVTEETAYSFLFHSKTKTYSNNWKQIMWGSKSPLDSLLLRELVHNDLLLLLPSSPIINAMIQLDLHPPLEIIALPGHLLGSNTHETVRVLLNLLGPDKVLGLFSFYFIVRRFGLGFGSGFIIFKWYPSSDFANSLCLCMP